MGKIHCPQLPQSPKVTTNLKSYMKTINKIKYLQLYYRKKKTNFHFRRKRSLNKEINK